MNNPAMNEIPVLNQPVRPNDDGEQEAVGGKVHSEVDKKTEHVTCTGVQDSGVGLSPAFMDRVPRTEIQILQSDSQ